MSRRRRNPLQPLLGVVTAFASVASCLLVSGLAHTVYVAISRPVCVHDLWRDVCLEQPSGSQRLLSVLLSLPTSAAYVAALILLMRLLIRAERLGPHSSDIALGARRYGLFLLISMPVATLVESIVRNVLVPHEALSFLGEWDFPWWALFTGLGLLTLAKILHAGAEMRAELEGTV
ncbi:hypothetical protein ACQPZF_05355 [Actinosynnema sp. CS-041913]|uniref:hypothetical protein n=1 Tax=Actinosynnema sp. CS-041913 TaxID=3239917 RepID=UPI003D91910B